MRRSLMIGSHEKKSHESLYIEMTIGSLLLYERNREQCVVNAILL